MPSWNQVILLDFVASMSSLEMENQKELKTQQHQVMRPRKLHLVVPLPAFYYNAIGTIESNKEQHGLLR